MRCARPAVCRRSGGSPLNEEPPLIRRRITVRGIVQGVGFRPFVYRLATRHLLAGFVHNDSAGVTIEIEGPLARVDAFAAELVATPPPLASIDVVTTTTLPPTAATTFVIRNSALSDAPPAVIPADIGPCLDCLIEQADPTNRRFGHAFINCTNCGPRFTIVAGLPYDRATTSMAPFPMCTACRAEYDDPTNRRFHAEPICCHGCGPTLRFFAAPDANAIADAANDGNAVTEAVASLLDGHIVAIKGVGGYHLAVRADDEVAVQRLRNRKRRDEKPFAILVCDLDAAGLLAEIDSVEAAALAAPERPIVLLAKRDGGLLARAVAPSSTLVGVLLPPSPLHQLLADTAGIPLVLTSGNISDEPISMTDDDAFGRLGSIADAFLTHDRAILRRADDSVLTVGHGQVSLIRRARGFAPRPIRLASTGPNVLAVGAGMKNTICVTRGNEAFVSPHLGDLENLSAFEAFRDMVDSLLSLLRVQPEAVVHDLHPGYLSTSHAQTFELPTIGVQHHHAHVASCLVEHQLAGPVVGVAFDGLGYGTDGGLWGGEFLVADLARFERAGSLLAVPLPGGSAALRQPWRMALAYLQAAYCGDVPQDLAVVSRNAHRWEAVSEISTRPSLSPPTHGVGRLFDAVASLLGFGDDTAFEGQAPMALEQAARRAGPSEPYEAGPISGGEMLQLDPSCWIRAMVDDVGNGTSVDLIASRFHATLAAGTVQMVELFGRRHGIQTAVLTGGVFQNRLLLESCQFALQRLGWTVYVHAKVPAGDGGISLGQAGVARRILSAR